MTTTAQTESRYQATAERLIGKCLAEFSIADLELTDQILVDWMISHRTDWSAATWRQYRSALAFNRGPQMTALLDVVALPPAAPRGRKTSGLKAKKLPPTDLQKLFNYLTAKGIDTPSIDCSSANFAAMFLVCGTITGLRPTEWRYVQIVSPEHDRGLRLRIRNAKDTEGRAHGKYRDLDFQELDTGCRQLLLAHIALVHQLVQNGRLETAMSSARRALLRANRALWPNRRKTYTLYSSRHQAASNWKTTMTQEEIAALMGHASLLTAATHYGRRSAGRTTVMPDVAVPVPIPSPDDIAAVRAISLAKAAAVNLLAASMDVDDEPDPGTSPNF
jgi:integrase